MRIPRGPPQPQAGGGGGQQQQGQGQNWGAPPNQYQQSRGPPMRNYGNEMGAAYGSYTVGCRSLYLYNIYIRYVVYIYMLEFSLVGFISSL